MGNNVEHVCTEGVELSGARMLFIYSEQESPLLLSK